jgi:hypothetical protein
MSLDEANDLGHLLGVMEIDRANGDKAQPWRSML